MGNRYTISTLTKREMESIQSAYAKLYQIHKNRTGKNGPSNEAQLPLKHLVDAMNALTRVSIAVNDVRMGKEVDLVDF